MSLIDDLTWCDRHDVEGSLCYERGYPLEQCVKGTRLVLDPRVLADGPVILLPDEGEGVRVARLTDVRSSLEAREQEMRRVGRLRVGEGSAASFDSILAAAREASS